MDWLDKMNRAIDYIEQNLDGEIDMSVVAQLACCSLYNFQRMFSFITDIPLGEYIRRRRLSQAALSLRNGNVRVLDVALQYGYESPVSFTRAFQAMHGMTPSQARRDGVTLKAYPRISFQISIKGASEMNYRIETKEAFDIFGMETLASTLGDPSYQTPGELWQECHANGSYEKLAEDAGKLPSWLPQDLCCIHGAVNYRKTTEGTFPYMLCAFQGPYSRTDGYTTAHIPAQTYAIFPSPRFSWDTDFFPILTTLQKQFYSEWLPVAPYDKADGPEFEIYGGTPEYGYIELWYPVVPHSST